MYFETFNLRPNQRESHGIMYILESQFDEKCFVFPRYDNDDNNCLIVFIAHHRRDVCYLVNLLTELMEFNENASLRNSIKGLEYWLGYM